MMRIHIFLLLPVLIINCGEHNLNNPTTNKTKKIEKITPKDSKDNRPKEILSKNKGIDSPQFLYAQYLLNDIVNKIPIIRESVDFNFKQKGKAAYNYIKDRILNPFKTAKEIGEYIKSSWGKAKAYMSSKIGEIKLSAKECWESIHVPDTQKGCLDILARILSFLIFIALVAVPGSSIWFMILLVIHAIIGKRKKLGVGVKSISLKMEMKRREWQFKNIKSDDEKRILHAMIYYYYDDIESIFTTSESEKEKVMESMSEKVSIKMQQAHAAIKFIFNNMGYEDKKEVFLGKIEEKLLASNEEYLKGIKENKDKKMEFTAIVRQLVDSDYSNCKKLVKVYFERDKAHNKKIYLNLYNKVDSQLNREADKALNKDIIKQVLGKAENSVNYYTEFEKFKDKVKSIFLTKTEDPIYASRFYKILDTQGRVIWKILKATLPSIIELVLQLCGLAAVAYAFKKIIAVENIL